MGFSRQEYWSGVWDECNYVVSIHQIPNLFLQYKFSLASFLDSKWNSNFLHCCCSPEYSSLPFLQNNFFFSKNQKFNQIEGVFFFLFSFLFSLKLIAFLPAWRVIQWYKKKGSVKLLVYLKRWHKWATINSFYILSFFLQSLSLFMVKWK